MKSLSFFMGIFKFFVLVALFSIFSPSVFGQIYYSGTGVIFQHDGVGNRIVREMQTICIGPGCPPIIGGESGSRSAANDSGEIKSNSELAVNETKVVAYPNPVQEDLFVNNETWKENDKAVVVVYDINGKLLDKEDFVQATGKIHFKNFTPGSYIVRYYLNDIPVENWKIIKN